jgi:putative endonuclease
MAWVYILETISRKYYVGSTTNLKLRVRQHLNGQSRSTKALGAQKLVLSHQYKTLKEARAVEAKIKRLKRRDYIEKMIQDGYIKLSPP